jgi:hypothetical protein
LPQGVTLNPTTGVLSGIPATGTAGTYPITFTTNKGPGTAATQTSTLLVGLVPTFTTGGSGDNHGRRRRQLYDHRDRMTHAKTDCESAIASRGDVRQ